MGSWQPQASQAAAMRLCGSTWGLSAIERTLANFVVLTKDGKVISIEIVGGLGMPTSPSAILIRGPGRGARIDVIGRMAR